MAEWEATLSRRFQRGGRDVPGQQRLDVGQRLCLWQFLKDVAQVREGLDARPFAGFDEAVEFRRGVCAGQRVREQPCLSSDDKRADRILAEHVADFDTAIVEIARERRPFLGEVVDGLARVRLWRYRVAVSIEPGAGIAMTTPWSRPCSERSRQT